MARLHRVKIWLSQPAILADIFRIFLSSYCRVLKYGLSDYDQDCVFQHVFQLFTTLLFDAMLYELSKVFYKSYLNVIKLSLEGIGSSVDALCLGSVWFESCPRHRLSVLMLSWYCSLPRRKYWDSVLNYYCFISSASFTFMQPEAGIVQSV